jgi:hypothetical protein
MFAYCHIMHNLSSEPEAKYCPLLDHLTELTQPIKFLNLYNLKNYYHHHWHLPK